MTFHPFFLVIGWVAELATVSNNFLKISWSNELGLHSLEKIEGMLAEPGDISDFEVILEDGSKRKIENCKDFLSVVKHPFDTQIKQDWNALWAQGARCFGLEALSLAKVPT